MKKLIIPKSTGKRVRADGFIFRGYNCAKNGTLYEHWISPKARKKEKKRKANWSRQYRTKIKENPIRLKKARQYAKIYVRKHRRENPLLYMLVRARIRAKQSNLPFTIKLTDLKLPKVCPIFGMRLKVNDKIGKDSSPEIDRINNLGGYTKENIVIVSRRANRIKSDSTIKELQKLYKFYSKLVK
ncbi:MAG: hypothetical protein V3U54_08845 [Thermodesulfobacteriota bacterium]